MTGDAHNLWCHLELSKASRVSSSSEELKLSLHGWWTDWGQAESTTSPAPYIHLVHLTSFTWWIFPGLCRSSTSVYNCQHKPKLKKRGRPENEAKHLIIVKDMDYSVHNLGIGNAHTSALWHWHLDLTIALLLAEPVTTLYWKLYGSLYWLTYDDMTVDLGSSVLHPHHQSLVSHWFTNPIWTSYWLKACLTDPRIQLHVHRRRD